MLLVRFCMSVDGLSGFRYEMNMSENAYCHRVGSNLHH